MRKISHKFVQETFEKAKSNSRKRQHYNFHHSYEEPLQRLLNAMTLDTYIPPHRHIDSGKLEILIALHGSFVLLEFDDDGNVIDHYLVGKEYDGIAVEIKPETWHTALPLEEGTVLYELKEGPFDPNLKKVFAPWAPADATEEGLKYIHKIYEERGIKVKL
jgi:cupin fold WbuC family metalloprotein